MNNGDKAFEAEYVQRSTVEDQLRAAVEALRATNLKLDSMEGPVNDCLAFRALHGVPYRGPNWGNERAANAAIVDAYDAQHPKYMDASGHTVECESSQEGNHADQPR